MGQAVTIGPELVRTAERSQRRRFVMRIAVLLSFAALVAATAFVYPDLDSRWQYAKVAKRLDRTDPGWQPEAIEAARLVVPAAENAALLVLEAQKLGAPFPATSVMGGIVFGGSEPEIRLDDDRVARIRSALAPLQPALEKARAIADCSRGRYVLDWSKAFLTVGPDHLTAVGTVSNWLCLDAALRCRDGDLDGALRSAAAALNVARSIGDEPLVFSQSVRMHAGTVAVACIEHVLAHGSASEPVLADLQAALEAELACPSIEIGLRGERAALDRAFAAICAGDQDLGAYFTVGGGRNSLPTWVFSTRTIRQNRTWVLEHMTQAIELAQAPEAERPGRLRDFDAMVSNELVGGGWMKRFNLVPSSNLFPSVTAFLGAQAHQRAVFRCAIAGLSAERFRLRTGQLPRTLEELRPAFLAAALTDPYSLGPLRVKTLDDGLLIYSVGADLRDDGGDRTPLVPTGQPTDVGFRLRDEMHRRPPSKDAELPRDIFEPLSR